MSDSSNRLQHIKTLGIFSVYPVLFMFPALFSSDTIMAKKTFSDVGHYVWVAQQLEKMNFPWSHNFMINAPDGVAFWNPAAFVNGAYWMVLWFLTRFVTPIVAINVTLVAGWILSGVSAYIFARRLSATYAGAIIAGLSLQMLPWFREKILAHPLYVFWFVPIFVLMFSIDFIRNVTFRNLVILASALIGTFFVDLYWFWYSIDLVVVVFIVNFFHIIRQVRRWLHWQQAIAVLGAISFPSSVFFAYRFLQRQTRSDTTWERPLEIASAEFVDIFQGSLLRFVTPHPEHLLFPNDFLFGVGREDAVNYVGISLLILGAGVLAFMYRDSCRREILTVVALVGFAAWFTLPTDFMVLGVNLGFPADILRVVNPGIRVFSRFGMIAQAMLCIVAGVTVSKILGLFRNRKLLGAVILILISIDLNPISRRLSSAVFADYEVVRKELAIDKRSVTLELWPDLNRLYFPRYLIDGAKAFTWAEYIDRSNEIRLHASRGDLDFYGYLRSRGVTHVLIPEGSVERDKYWAKWGKFGSIDLKFPTEYFKKIEFVNGMVPATLFRLVNQKSMSFCVDCKSYSVSWSEVHMGFAGMIWSAEQDSNSYVDGPNLSWVLAGERPTFQIVAQDGKMRSYEVNISMVAAFGPKAPPQVVTVTSKDGATSFDLVAGVQQDVKVVVNSGDVVELKSQMPCVVPEQLEPGSGDFRELCFGVTDFKVREVFP
jgi:hypothetical protein